MTPEEALATIRAEGLGRYRWFEDATNDADIVAIQRTESGWVVFATDERAAAVLEASAPEVAAAGSMGAGTASGRGT